MLVKAHFDSNQNNTPNSAKKSTGKYNSFGLPFVLFHISCTSSFILFTLSKQFQKLTHLPDSPDPPVWYSCSVAGKQKEIMQEIPADDTFIVTLKGSLSGMIDQGLSLPVVVETPN